MVRRLKSPKTTCSTALAGRFALACFSLLVFLPVGGLRAQPKEPVVDQSFSIRQDVDLFQLEEAVTLIASSLGKISDQVKTLALNSMHFGKSTSGDFRRKADVAVVFGCPDDTGPTAPETLAERVRTGCQLYREGLVGKLIFTGDPGSLDVQQTGCSALRRAATLPLASGSSAALRRLTATSMPSRAATRARNRSD